MQRIDLSELTGDGEVRNLSGHERGLAARKKFDLDAIDARGESVVVVVPEEVYSMASSFFQGMFSASVLASGDRETFLSHYLFDAPTVVLRQIERGIEASLMKRRSIFAS
jgi:hypothetical protein